tara:strand:+ start:451 stop:633 length:183 start_codon:yes stop_codon:yes gene_type:complete
MEGLGTFLVLWTLNNIEFITVKNEQIAEGYEWVELAECREPDTSLPHFTWMGKICYKLEK